MRLALILCTLCVAVCLASALGQQAQTQAQELPTKLTASGYPKKVTTLKKRPLKTILVATTNSNPVTTKPSKPRVKISTLTTKAATTKATATSASTTTTKAPALPASFSNLPADDLEFIKELDKQFKLHGNKIKIKVERDNSTSNGKNNKRTIDGELGYGYHQGYDYTPPKFMFYPYSQHDIPATAEPDAYTGYSPADYEHAEVAQPQQPSHPHQQVTSVTIEPSYSYELKPQTSYEQQQPAGDQHGHLEVPQIDLPQPHSHGDEAAGYQEPVIVLRIPGPAKYAAHLQALLQQYLEIRAAQYLQLLQEAEQHKQEPHQTHHHHQEQEELPSQSYAPQEQHDQAHYHPEVNYAHQLAPTPPPVQYAAIDDVYQTYKGRHQHQPLPQPQYEQAAAPEAYYAPTSYQHQQQHQQQPQFYYAQPQQQTEYESSYHQPQLYLIAMSPQAQYTEQAEAVAQHASGHEQQQQPIYVPEQEPPTAPEAGPAAHEHDLPITENNPRSTHTKVIFNAPSSDGDYAPKMYAYEEEQQHHHHHQLHHQHQHQHQQQTAESSNSHAAAAAAETGDYQSANSATDSMAITQAPFNYHAHGLKMARPLRPGKRSAKAEHPADKQLQQIREFVRDKLGAEMGSAVEYKTTHLLEG